MTKAADYTHRPDETPEYRAPSEPQHLTEEDTLAMAAMYQQIADRRAQVENAEILRRARAL